jgi:hypothetical protein
MAPMARAVGPLNSTPLSIEGQRAAGGKWLRLGLAKWARSRAPAVRQRRLTPAERITVSIGEIERATMHVGI